MNKSYNINLIDNIFLDFFVGVFFVVACIYKHHMVRSTELEQS